MELRRWSASPRLGLEFMFKLLLVLLEIVLVLICPYSCMLADATAISNQPEEHHVCPCCEKCADQSAQAPQGDEEEDQDGGRGDCFCKGALVVGEHAAGALAKSSGGISSQVCDLIPAVQFSFSSSPEALGFHRGWHNAGRALRLFFGSLQI